MADPRYRNGIHVAPHRPVALNLSNPNHPLNHGWLFSYWNDDHSMAVYTQEGMKLMSYKGDRLVQFPNREIIHYEGWEMQKLTEDALKELVTRSGIKES